jgi:hypothetical protein
VRPSLRVLESEASDETAGLIDNRDLIGKISDERVTAQRQIVQPTKIEIAKTRGTDPQISAHRTIDVMIKCL